MVDSEDKGEKVPECPKCGKEFPIFDGRNCHTSLTGCGYKVRKNASKVIRRYLSSREVISVCEQLGFD